MRNEAYSTECATQKNVLIGRFMPDILDSSGYVSRFFGWKWFVGRQAVATLGSGDSKKLLINGGQILWNRSAY